MLRPPQLQRRLRTKSLHQTKSCHNCCHPLHFQTLVSPAAVRHFLLLKEFRRQSSCHYKSTFTLFQKLFTALPLKFSFQICCQIKWTFMWFFCRLYESKVYILHVKKQQYGHICTNISQQACWMASITAQSNLPNHNISLTTDF